MAAPPAPLPPDVTAQQSPEGAQSAFMAQGVGQPQPGMEMIQQALQKTQELETWFNDMVGMLRQIHPPLVATLAPMAKAVQELRQQLTETAQRSGMAQGSPVMPVQPQGNPGAGPPNPMSM